MRTKIELGTAEKLEYLLVYRSWFLLLAGALFLIAATGSAFITIEVSTTGLVVYTPFLAVALIVNGALVAVSLVWSFFTEYRILKIRKRLLSEMTQKQQNGVIEQKETLPE